MNSHNESLLNDVAAAIGNTLGRVTSTAADLVGTAKKAKKKASARTARKVRKTTGARKTRVRPIPTVRKSRSKAASQTRNAAPSKRRRTVRRTGHSLR